MATELGRPPHVLDSGSFERFYRRHVGEIYRYVLHDVGNRADAEELTQTAFLDAYRALRRGHEPESPRAWMYGIARNATRRRYRTRSRRPHEVELHSDLDDKLVDEKESLEPEAIRAAIAALRPSHREVLFLREVEGLSYAEIARRMELTHAAVETLLFRARRSARELLLTEGVRPAVRAGRGKSLGGLLVAPAFLARFGNRIQQLLAPGLATKAAGACTAVALSAGVAIGTQTAPLGAAASRADAQRADAVSATPSIFAVASGRVEPNIRMAAAEVSEGKKPSRENRGPSRGEGRKPSDDQQAPASNGSGGSAGLGSGGGAPIGGATIPTPSVTVPAISTPSVEVPPVTAPGSPASTPTVEAPSVSTSAVEVPSVSTQAVEVPAVSTPAVEVPAVSTPAVEVPAVSTPAVEVPSVPGDVPVETGVTIGG